jgi:hypothetical protein
VAWIQTDDLCSRYSRAKGQTDTLGALATGTGTITQNIIPSACSAGIQKTDKTQHNKEHIHCDADQTGFCNAY